MSLAGLFTGWFLMGGRGLATPFAGESPGRRSLSARDDLTGDAMRIKDVQGRPSTDSAGAAQRLGLALNTVHMYSAPSQRATTGFPSPVREDGVDWFALDDLDTYAAARRPPAPAPPPVDDPDQLIGVEEFAKLRGVKPGTMRRYVELAVPEWDRHTDGILPIPDKTEPARHGSTYKWRLGKAHEWTFPAKPRRSSGRRPGRRPTPADLAQVLAEPDAAKLKNKEIARKLEQQLNLPPGEISLQVIHRLKRRLAELGDNPA